MQTIRSSILPIIAFLLTILSLSYSAGHKSKGETTHLAAAAGLKEELSKFEHRLAEIKSIHIEHIKKYSDEMGCLRDSKALAIINHHNELLRHHEERLQYHKMKMLQSDTGNVSRGNIQIKELKMDYNSLDRDALEIQAGFDNYHPAE